MNRLFEILKNGKVLLSIIISICGLYFAFYDFNLVEFNNSIEKLNFKYFILACIMLIFSVYIRSIRWLHFIDSKKVIPTSSLFKNQMIGYFGNNVLPLRFGEFIRSYLLGKEFNLSLSYVFGTIITEKILDMITLFILFLLLLIFKSFEFNILDYLGLIFLLIIFSMFILLVLVTYKKKLASNKILKDFIDGLSSLSYKQIPKLFFYSICIWGIYWLDIYIIGMAFSFNLSFIDCLLLLVFITAVISVPSAPGMIGTFHLASKFIMSEVLGYNIDDSNAFTIVLHSYSYITYSIVGAYFFIINQYRGHGINSYLNYKGN